MVAIVLVNYNGFDDTIACISSLSECSYKDYIIIVVDNCSTDESVRELKSAQMNYDFVLLKASDNRGFSAGNNIGIRYALEAGADYVLLLNNDTLVEPNFLELLIEGFFVYENCGVTIGKIYYEKWRDTIWYAGGSLSLKTARTSHWRFDERDNNMVESPKTVTFATGCCMCLSRKLIEDIGFLDESYFLYEEDAEYCCRLLLAGYKIVYVPAAVIYHKVSSSTGAASPMTQYYTMRNKYIMIRQHFKGMNKLSAYIYCTAQMLYRCLCRGVKFRYYWAALKAFRNHETGKAENIRL